MKRVEEEMVYSKLKHSTVFACPKCGSTRFTLVWSWELETFDSLKFDREHAIVHIPDISDDWDPWDLQYISHAECISCGYRISKNKIQRIFEETKVKYSEL